MQELYFLILILDKVSPWDKASGRRGGLYVLPVFRRCHFKNPTAGCSRHLVSDRRMQSALAIRPQDAVGTWGNPCFKPLEEILYWTRVEFLISRLRYWNRYVRFREPRIFPVQDLPSCFGWYYLENKGISLILENLQLGWKVL